MKRSRAIGSLFALIVSVQVAGCGESMPASTDQALVNSFAASENTRNKTGVTSWNLFRDKITGETMVKGARPDGTIEEEMSISQDADKMITISRTFHAPAGGAPIYSAAVRFDPGGIDPMTGTGPTFPPPPPNLPCLGCMNDDFQSVLSSGQLQSLGLAEGDSCNVATGKEIGR